MRFFWLLVICIFTGNLAADEYVEPLAVYLTWQHDPSHSMTVRWITTDTFSEDIIEYYPIIENGVQQAKKAKGKHKPLPEGHGEYFVHTAELSDLQAATTYGFRIPFGGGKEYKFRTMPEDLKEPIRFVVGGDIYHDDITHVETTNKVAAATDPLFAMLGGDIAYASKTRFWGCWDNCARWMTWLNSWTKTMVTPEGYLIPILPVIGNHDVQGGFDKTPSSAPFFYALFAVPGFQGYHVVDFGNYMSIFLLDSGHTHPIEAEQTGWLDVSLKRRKAIPNKFALYHVGAYPSYRSQELPICMLIRKWWVPLFEKYHLTAAFENHDHTYKRTHLLKNNKIDPEGVLYIGDGSWGIEKPRKPHTPEERWYLAKTVSTRQVTLVTLTDKERLYQAINDNGTIIDEFRQEYRN